MDDTLTPAVREERVSPASLIHLSNLLTYGSLLCGVAAIGAAVWLRSAGAAGAALALAVLADTFDGRFARRFQRTDVQRRFGVQVDSLTDAIVSGAIPVVVMLVLVARGSTSGMLVLWGAVTFTYLLSVVTRLGFYNLTHDDEPGADFIGLPTPVSTLLVSTVLVSPTTWRALGVMTAASILMVAPIRVPRPRGVGLALFAAWAVSLVIVHGSRW